MCVFRMTNMCMSPCIVCSVHYIVWCVCMLLLSFFLLLPLEGIKCDHVNFGNLFCCGHTPSGVIAKCVLHNCRCPPMQARLVECAPFVR